MDKKYSYVIYDFNNLFWRSIISSLEKTKNINDYALYNEAIMMFFTRLKELENKFCYKETLSYFLCDNPESHINIRKIITDGQYKHSRESKNLPKNLYKTLNIIIEILKSYSSNYRIVQCENLEADDLTLPVKKLLNITNQNQCLFISADLDWARNIDENCHWYNYYTVHDITSFKKKYEFSPVGKSIQLWKALKGDNSDCIKNAVPYLPNEILLDILNRFKDLEDLYSNLWQQDYPKEWKIKLNEAKINIRTNYQLADFIEVTGNISTYIYECSENLKKLEFWFKTLDIPFEGRMLLDKSIKPTFFEKKKYKRV